MSTRRKSEPQANNRRLQELETHLVPKPAHGGDLRIHLAYPNHYWVAMSNLGFQAVYRILASIPGVVVERVFLPENPFDSRVFDVPWRTFESNRLISDCDVLAFSLSFETDYPHLFRMLRNAGLLTLSSSERARRADESKFSSPILVAGGTAVTLNPEPVADLLDVVMLGEAEEWLPEFIESLRKARSASVDRGATLSALAELEGSYIPSLFRPQYGGRGEYVGFVPEAPPHRLDAARRAQRRFVKNLSDFPAYTGILTPETEFRSMFLAETGRGCEMGCRFCVAGYIYRPVRKRDEASLRSTVQLGLGRASAIGFVGAAVSSHRSIAKLAHEVAETGARASLSSLMSQKVTKELAASLSESEYKTVALAPEAGSERLRRAAGKRVTNAQVIEAARELAGAGIRGFKLYFIVGLPTETDQDVDAIVDLAKAVRDAVVEESRASGKAAWIVLSVNPFIPKANTPFQWEAMLDQAELTRRIGLIRRSLARCPNIEFHFEPPKESYFQALLSRGDRRVAKLLYRAEELGKDWKWVLSRACRDACPEVPEVSFFAQRQIPYEERLPWEIVDSRIDRRLLLREALRAKHGEDYRLPDDGPEAEVETVVRPEVDSLSMLREHALVSSSSARTPAVSTGR